MCECAGPGAPSGAHRGLMQDSPAQEGQPRRKHVAWSTQAPEIWKQVEGSSGDRGLVWLTPDRPLVPVLPERQHGRVGPAPEAHPGLRQWGLLTPPTTGVFTGLT